MIHVYDPEGREVRRIFRAWDPRPLRTEDVDQLLMLARDSLGHLSPGTYGVAAAAFVSQIEQIAAAGLPDVAPPLGDQLVSHDGSFWVERADALPPAIREIDVRFAAYTGRRKPSTWDLFDADGNFLATVEVPTRFTPMAVNGTDVIGVLRDELEVEYVVTLRSEPG